jgi:hypothetical protein
MHRSIPVSAPRPAGVPRRLVLGTAFVLALAVWAAPKIPAAVAQDAKPAAGTAAAVPAPPSPPPAPSLPAPDKAATPASKPATAPGFAIHINTDEEPGAAKGATGKNDAAGTVTEEKDPVTGERTITVKKGHKTVTVAGIGPDRKYPSVGAFVHNEPALATMVVLVVAVIFLSPVLAIALILAYRMRRTRMQNETLLKLAEQGVVAPAEAMNAVTSGTMPAQLKANGGAQAGAATAASPVDQVRELRKRAAWSDLRKGVLMGAVGLGLVLFSAFDDHSPNGLGLVLLFVGAGFVLLWWFEDRQIKPRRDLGAVPPGPGTGGGF